MWSDRDMATDSTEEVWMWEEGWRLRAGAIHAGGKRANKVHLLSYE